MTMRRDNNSYTQELQELQEKLNKRMKQQELEKENEKRKSFRTKNGSIDIEKAIDHLKYSITFHDSRGLDREAMQAMVLWIREQQENTKRQDEWEANLREAEAERIGIRAYYRD